MLYEDSRSYLAQQKVQSEFIKAASAVFSGDVTLIDSSINF